MARALRSNHSVLSMSLRLNRLGDEGGKAICDVLRANTTMQKLNLSANSLGPQTAAALASLVKTNRTLIHVDVSSNSSFGPEGGRLIRDALEHNDIIRSMDVRMCGMGEELEASISDVVKANAENSEGNMYGAGKLTSSMYLDNLT